MFRKPCYIGTQKSQNTNIKTRYKKQNKTNVFISAYLSRENKLGYLIPSMNCYLRNGYFRDPDFMS